MADASSTVGATVAANLARLEPLLQRTKEDPRAVVLMTCGVSGAGKTTHTRALLARHPSFTRLSLDAIIHEKHGLYSQDYTPDHLETYQDEADQIFRSRLVAILEEGTRDIVLDRAFYAKEDRDEFRAIVGQLGGRVVLVYFKFGLEELWRRVVGRRARGSDADNARVISRELMENFVKGFAEPMGEGEVLIRNDGGDGCEGVSSS